MAVDFGKTADDYGRHRAGFPALFFERLFEKGFVQPGARVLDLGTGTGTVARGLAQRGCAVTGLDPSAPMLETARRLDAEAGIQTEYVQAPAEATALPDGAFDVVTAGQCWHWFDRRQAAAEARRLLVPGGRLIIGHFDWLPLEGNVVAATEKLILAHNPAWRAAGGTGIYPPWFADLALGGFKRVESFSFDLDVPYRREAWLGRIRASAGVGASLSPEAVAVFDAEHAALLAADFPDDPLTIPHRVFVVSGVSV